VIQGGRTKLNRPEGIALDADGDALYVVNHNGNSLLEFEAVGTSGGNIAPTLIISGKAAKMNLPVGVALSQFTAP
jgi:DNA-binding beta-propeller fold protein YncE